MKELLTVVTRKGQITIPAEIRRSLGILEGDKVALSLSDEGKPQVILRPVRSVAELTFGAVTPRKRPEDFKELRRIFEDEMASRTMSKAPPADES